MSVRTTADEQLTKAKEHIDAAIKALADIEVNKCWGHDEFKSEYRDNISDAFNALRVTARKLE